jgi:3-oxoacyl-[acyl-carrier protein] reductase
MKRFENKNVLVTGAGSGIGFGVCRHFAQEGAIVALNDKNEALANEAATRINKEIGVQRVYPCACDIANVEAVRKMVNEFASTHKGLHVLVANAGITNYGAFLTYTPEAFDTLTSVNMRGSYFSAQAAALAMIEYKIPGRIILMSSVTGVQAHINLSAYGMTKAALRLMARGLALELGPYGITVNAIGAGATITERTLTDDPNYEKNWNSVAPNGRTGYVEDVANTALFLASAEARHITGDTIMVDGGWTIYSPVPQNHPTADTK